MGCVGHTLFTIIHIAAALFFCWPLLITIPLHLVFAAVLGKSDAESEPDEETTSEPAGVAVLAILIAAAVIVFGVIWIHNNRPSAQPQEAAQPEKNEVATPPRTSAEINERGPVEHDAPEGDSLATSEDELTPPEKEPSDVDPRHTSNDRSEAQPNLSHEQAIEFQRIRVSLREIHRSLDQAFDSFAGGDARLWATMLENIDGRLAKDRRRLSELPDHHPFHEALDQAAGYAEIMAREVSEHHDTTPRYLEAEELFEQHIDGLGGQIVAAMVEARSEEEASQRAEWEKAARQRSQQSKSTSEQVERGFSVWDGSHIELTKVIKAVMRDPASYQHVQTVFRERDDHLLVTTTYRGSNAFGGIVTEQVTARVSMDGKVLSIVK